MSVNRFGWLLAHMHLNTIKRGFIIWCLVDKHGYLWNFEVYTGKVGDSVENQLGARVVKQLSQPLQNKNHLLFFDNYFTSYPLKSKNIHACGTINLQENICLILKKIKIKKLENMIGLSIKMTFQLLNGAIKELLAFYQTSTTLKMLQRYKEDQRMVQ